MRNPQYREMASLVTHIRRLCSLTLSKRLSVVGHSVHEYAVLFRLVTDPEVPQHELAYDAAIDPAAVSRLVQAMTRTGLVTTRVDPTDKRQRFVRITAKGRALERTLSPVVDDALEPLLAGLSSAEEQQIVSLLRKCYQHAASAALEVEAGDARASMRAGLKQDKEPDKKDEDVPRAGLPTLEAPSTRAKRVVRRRAG